MGRARSKRRADYRRLWHHRQCQILKLAKRRVLDTAFRDEVNGDVVNREQPLELLNHLSHDEGLGYIEHLPYVEVGEVLLEGRQRGSIQLEVFGRA